MFKRFSERENVSSHSQLKSSALRAVRARIIEQYPPIEEIIDELFPKKSPVFLYKCSNHTNLLVHNKVPLFFSIRDSPYIPTLRLVHQYPGIMEGKVIQIDKGAIPFVLGGANVMSPGLTNPGGYLTDGLEENDIVVIRAHEKEFEIGLGMMKLSTDVIRDTKKDTGVTLLHHINDGLWRTETMN